MSRAPPRAGLCHLGSYGALSRDKKVGCLAGGHADRQPARMHIFRGEPRSLCMMSSLLKGRDPSFSTMASRCRCRSRCSSALWSKVLVTSRSLPSSSPITYRQHEANAVAARLVTGSPRQQARSSQSLSPAGDSPILPTMYATLLTGFARCDWCALWAMYRAKFSSLSSGVLPHFCRASHFSTDYGLDEHLGREVPSCSRNVKPIFSVISLRCHSS